MLESPVKQVDTPIILAILWKWHLDKHLGSLVFQQEWKTIRKIKNVVESCNGLIQ